MLRFIIRNAHLYERTHVYNKTNDFIISNEISSITYEDIPELLAIDT
jgi:hypothetical protein